MKCFFLLVFLVCVACNPYVNEDTKEITDAVGATSTSYSFVEDVASTKKFSGDSIRIFIAEEEQYDYTLLPVSDKFYDQFIKDNSHFENKRQLADFADGANVSHFYWGQIENTYGYKLLLISQRQVLDFAVNKVFLFVLGENDNLLSVTPVAELGYYPGGHEIRYSTLLNHKRLETVFVQEDIIDVAYEAKKQAKYLYEKDSTIFRYAFDAGKFKRTFADTIKTSYWTK